MIIGFAGKKRHGKSEAAKYLAAKWGVPVYSFATGIKDIVFEVSGLTDANKDDTTFYTNRVFDLKPIKKELFKYRYDQLTSNEVDHLKAIEYGTVGEIYRNLMQYIGTNIFRSRNNLHWCQRFSQDHRAVESFIVDDIRFKNEFYAIKNMKDSYIYKIVRPSLANDVDNHPSEQEGATLPIEPANIIMNTAANLSEYFSALDKIFK